MGRIAMNAKNFLKILTVLPVVTLAGYCAAAPASTNSTAAMGDKAKPSTQSTNDALAELPVPLSVFEITSTPTKDPFYPLSTRQTARTVTTNTEPFSASSFTLKGLSGTGKGHLALINNRTVAAGEDAEVSTPTGKVKIHCVEIKEASVVIQSESSNDSLEIFLRKAAQ